MLTLVAGAVIGAIFGVAAGLIVGGLRWVTSHGTPPPFGKFRSPLKDWLSWCLKPVLVCGLTATATGLLIGFMIGFFE